jgi:hydroxymethylpyrimidine/phosphomethylpyrimidine kinase
VQADARTIHAFGGFACMAITALTAQNTRGVSKWTPVEPKMIAAQIAAVLGRRSERGPGALPIRAIKTGLLPGAPAIRAIVRALAAGPLVPLVVDPVLGSTSGTRFLDDAGLRVLFRELLPRATLVTPNWPEAARLARGAELATFEQAENAAKQLAAELGTAVLIKGGHGPGAVCRDCLVLPGARVVWFQRRRVATRNKHGTGCVLASAIATELAHGRGLVEAVTRARDFLGASLRAHRHTDWQGAGPAFPG